MLQEMMSTKNPVVHRDALNHNIEPPFAMRSSRTNASSLDNDAKAEDAFAHTVETAAGSEPSIVACTTNRAMTSPCRNINNPLQDRHTK